MANKDKVDELTELVREEARKAGHAFLDMADVPGSLVAIRGMSDEALLPLLKELKRLKANVDTLGQAVVSEMLVRAAQASGVTAQQLHARIDKAMTEEELAAVKPVTEA